MLVRFDRSSYDNLGYDVTLSGDTDIITPYYGDDMAFNISFYLLLLRMIMSITRHEVPLIYYSA